MTSGDKLNDKIDPYRAYISWALNKKVKEQMLKKGNLVLPIKKPMVTNKTKGKFESKWEPFVI